jgi:uncharacterized membrane protein YoaK (UPF0700 family)
MSKNMNENKTSSTAKVNGSNALSIARKLMLVALVVHLGSLFLPYRDSEKEGDVYYMEKWHVVGLQGVSAEKTGFEEKPNAVYVIIGLLVLFGSDLYEEQVWRRYVYWISFVLLVVFAFGGAPFRTSGGKIAMICLATVLIAAYLNEKGLKQNNISST